MYIYVTTELKVTDVISGLNLKFLVDNKIT